MTDTVRGADAAPGKKKIIREFVKHRGNVIIFLFIWLAGMIFVKNFANLDNNLNIVTQSAIPAISCLGMTFVLMTGGIDLSVGYTLGFCSYMFGMFAIRMELPLIAALILTLVIGGICGLVNGLLVQIVKIPAFIVTLGTGYIIFGIAQIVSNGSAITNLPEHVLAIARAKFLGISSMVYIAAAVVLICWFVLHKSTYGRTLMSVGLNIKASRLSGVRAGYVTVMAYVTCGVCSALAAVLMATRVNNCVPTLGGTEFTFQVITAAILGGASLFGGVGSAWGFVLGVMTIYIIENCLGLLGVNYYMYTAILSIIILAAIVFENLKNRILQ